MEFPQDQLPPQTFLSTDKRNVIRYQIAEYDIEFDVFSVCVTNGIVEVQDAGPDSVPDESWPRWGSREAKMSGWIKWDGCSNWRTHASATDFMDHFCGFTGVLKHTNLVRDMYRFTMKNLPTVKTDMFDGLD
jgi:hypothetical protein